KLTRLQYVTQIKLLSNWKPTVNHSSAPARALYLRSLYEQVIYPDSDFFTVMLTSFRTGIPTGQTI
ncbi:hypothetical protein, partial [Escherichia coli]|uniref:hypothetical protein n=1 Tax=Escherichia coli TaxID=562 RepID=UPI0031B5720D